MSVADEVRALRSSAGISRASHVAIVHLEGPDTFDLLEHACTQSPYLREGRVLHTLLLRHDGGIFADAYVGSRWTTATTCSPRDRTKRSSSVGSRR